MIGLTPRAHSSRRYLSWSYPRSAIRLSARSRGRPILPRTGPTPSTNGSSWVTSLRLPPVSEIANGMPAGSTSRWCFEPVRPRSTGDGPVKAPLKSADMSAIDHRRRPVDRASRVEALEHRLVRCLPHAGRLPISQPPPRRRPEQPSSRGRCAHAIPVTKTKAIALKHTRSGTGRPCFSGTDTGGIMGSTTAHSSSRTSNTVATGHLRARGYVIPGGLRDRPRQILCATVSKAKRVAALGVLMRRGVPG